MASTSSRTNGTTSQGASRSSESGMRSHGGVLPRRVRALPRSRLRRCAAMPATAPQPARLTSEIRMKKVSCTISTPYSVAAMCETTHEPQVRSEDPARAVVAAPNRDDLLHQQRRKDLSRSLPGRTRQRPRASRPGVRWS